MPVKPYIHIKFKGKPTPPHELIRLIVSPRNQVFLVHSDGSETPHPEYQSLWDKSIEIELTEQVNKHGVHVWLQTHTPNEDAIDILEVEVVYLHCKFLFSSINGCTQWYWKSSQGFTPDMDLPWSHQRMVHGFFSTAIVPVESSIFNRISKLIETMKKEVLCSKNPEAHYHYMVKIEVRSEDWFTMHWICGSTKFRDIFDVLCGGRTDEVSLELLGNGNIGVITNGGAHSSKMISELPWPGFGKKMVLVPKPDWVLEYE